MGEQKMTATQYEEEHGYWSAHPEHPYEDWKYEVANEDTKQGYWDWAANREEED